MQDRFLTEFARVTDALAPWVNTGDDGFEWIAPDAPSDLTGIYRRMVSTGYAKGWL